MALGSLQYQPFWVKIKPIRHNICIGFDMDVIFFIRYQTDGAESCPRTNSMP